MNKYLIAFLIGIIAIGTLHGQDIIYCENNFKFVVKTLK